ncbi:MAG: hypothetical protein ABS75_20590 [Pelagibacterium sp. SCN 63-23]|nr:MAG: hypothetical protein ABS75_20590 [Pelagibacterium sp. SCN 63-23]
MVPTPRRHLNTAAMRLPTSQLLDAIEDFRDFAYAVEAAAKNRSKADALNDPVNPTYVISRMEIDARPGGRDAMTTTVTLKTTPEPTRAEMLAMVEKLRASPVARKWLAAQKLARAMSFDPIGDHVREHRPRGGHIQIDDAGDPDGGWLGKGDRS